MRELVVRHRSRGRIAEAVCGGAAPGSRGRAGGRRARARSRPRALGEQRWSSESIDAELTRLAFLVDAQTFYMKVVSPLVVTVGKRWRRGPCGRPGTSSLPKIELALRGMLRTMDRGDGPHVLLGALDGDFHVLGLLGAALRFAGGGATVTVLGAATPPFAIADAVRGMSPRLIGSSATLEHGQPRTLFKGVREGLWNDAVGRRWRRGRILR